MSQPTCIVMVGLPATGKSTRVRDITTMNPDAFVYSTDFILERIAQFLGKTYDDVFEDHIKSATAEADIDLAYAIKEKHDIIWDQTNLGVGKRRKIINRMRAAGYNVECECFLPPEASHIDDQKEWARRLAERHGKTIPPHIMTNMINTFVVPTEAEGFDAVYYFNMHGQVPLDQHGMFYHDTISRS